MGFFITEIGSSIEGCCLWNKTIQNASSHGFSKPHEFCINYNFFYVWYMVRFMLIVFISNQIEDTIDFDETIHLERGQNLFEIHVQKARKFSDNTAPCTHFLSEVNWKSNGDAYYFVNIWSFIGPIILWHYFTSKLFDTYVSPNYSVHVVVNVHLQLYMCLLGVIGEPVSWSHQDAGRWGGVDLLYLGVLWVWNSVHARTERSPPRVRLHLSVCRQGGRFLPPLSSEGEFSFYIIFSRPSLIICIVFSFKQKKKLRTHDTKQKY